MACTDPPYTVAGAELFLSRAVSGLEPEPGGHVFFSFGARRPDETLRAQQLIGSMGLAVRGAVAGLQRVPGRRHPGRHQPPVPPAQHGGCRGRWSRAMPPGRCTRPMPGRPRPGRTGARAAGPCTRSAPAAGGRASRRCRRPAARTAAARCSGRCRCGRARERKRERDERRGRSRTPRPARVPGPGGQGGRSRRDRRVRGGDRAGVVRRRGDHRPRAAPQAGRVLRWASRGRSRWSPPPRPRRTSRSAGPGCPAGPTR